jgi:hypothetical protein
LQLCISLVIEHDAFNWVRAQMSSIYHTDA